MNTRYLTPFSLAVFLLCLLPLSTFAKRVPGVTEDSIKVGVIADLSGPLAFYGKEQLEGMQLYINHVNNQGGVHGRKIVLLHEDDGYKPPRTIAAFRKLLDRDRVFCFVGNLGSATTMATFPLVKRAKVPLVCPLTFNSGMHTPFKKHVFPIGPSYDVQSWIMVKHILESSKEASPRIAVVYQDDEMGLDGLRGLRDAVEAYGIELVAEERYKREAIDFSSQVSNLKSKNPTHVILWTVYREAAAILKKAAQTGLKAQFIGGISISDPKVLELAGQDANHLQVVSAVDLWSGAPTQPVQTYLDLVNTHSPGRRITLLHSGGYLAAQVLVEGLERAGQDLSREKLVEALETFNQYENIGAPITYGPSTRGGTFEKAFILKALPDTLRFERITDWITYEPKNELAKKGKSFSPEG